MGDAKTKGAGAGALSGAAAGTAVMPGIGTLVGGIGGAALGYFGTEEAPDAPVEDPAIAAERNRLKAVYEKQQIDATQIGLRRDTASYNARFGTATDSASLLARYGAMLAASGG